MEPEKPISAENTSNSVGGDEGRGQSTIQFPYGDLDMGIEVVRTIHGVIGSSSCTPDQLAAAMGQTSRSGNFRLKTSTSRIFGLIATSPGKIEITDLGYEALDSSREKSARIQAFMNVELYKKVYDDFLHKQLPPRPAAFERMLERLGVAPKQTANARRILDNSAGQAGFFKFGKDRLVLPNVDAPEPAAEPTHGGAHEAPPTPDNKGSGGHGGGGGQGDDPQYHPFIQGLLRTLPAPETNWTVEGRAKWLQAAANIFDLMYKGSGEITVSSRKGSEAQPIGTPNDD